ncbi:MAG: family 43 glycosylhydrolase [Clostridia bacterium]|nr:family 43 glycosylhydrolase [Clostridia bacterium]
MKKLLTTLAAVAAISSAAFLVSCGGGNNNKESGKTDVGKFTYDSELLSKADDVSNGYNSNLFYVNTLEFQLADPSVIQVTEGEEKGWFYAYGTSDEINCHGFQAWRSKDLSHWESMGVAFQPDYNVAWASDNYWAPEVIYDNGVYYMFYNAFNANKSNSLWLSVAYSKSPAGPFVSPNGRRDANGKMLSASEPVFDVTGSNSELQKLAQTNPSLLKTNALDASPFIDPVTGDKYLYFSYYDNYGEGSFIYGMKMKDWFTPDYSTLKALTYPGYATVKGGMERISSERLNESSVNEGPFMMYKDGKYYLTFSVFGYQDPNYQVKQAIADSPLGDFVKISPDKGGKVISTDTVNWSHIVSAGHHSFITCGDELFIAYHTFKDRNSVYGGRALAVDRVEWTTNQDGVAVMHTNGPTWSVQPLPESLSGYKNIAPSATVTADLTSPDSDVKLLTDNLIKYQEFDLAEEYEATAGTSTIKLSWNEAKTARAILVYNSYLYENTFVNLSQVEIEYLKADGSTDKVTAQSVPFDWNWHFENDFEFIRPGGAAIMEFADLPVKSITITIKSADGAEKLALGEIVVLGKDEAVSGISKFEEYSYENAEYGSAHIVKESLNFGSPEKGVDTFWGYDLSHDDGTDEAYILQTGVWDQYAFFKDVYTTSFYAEAEITVTANKPFAKDPYPKFGLAVSCGGAHPNTIFYYVDAVGYTNTVVGCAQRRLDNSDWDWNATEQLVNAAGISYTKDNYVKLAILRLGKSFYLICNDKLMIFYDSFNIFGDEQNAGIGFLSFNTPMKIKNYLVTTDSAKLEEYAVKYANSLTGENFGKGGSFATTTGWDLSLDRGENPTAVQTANGDQYAFFKGVYTDKFLVKTDISVSKDLGDPYPKFGLVARVAGNTFFFYIDGTANYTAQRVGYVSQDESGNWIWSTSNEHKEADANLGEYKNGSSTTISMLRDGDTFSLYVGDTLVFTVSGIRGFGEGEASAVGILSFTTGITVTNYSVTTDI